MKYKTAKSTFPSPENEAEEIAEQVYYAEPYPNGSVDTIPKTAPIIQQALINIRNSTLDEVIEKLRRTAATNGSEEIQYIAERFVVELAAMKGKQ